MVSGHEQMKRFTTAARTLLEAGFVDVEAGRYSKTLFMSATRRSSEVEAAALLAAAEQGWSMVTLEFGRTGRAKGPLGYSVSFLNEGGASDVVHDCMLVRDDDGKFVLVPPSATYHFAVGPNGLERRHGRPAQVAASAIRAARSLAKATSGPSPPGVLRGPLPRVRVTRRDRVSGRGRLHDCLARPTVDRPHS